MGKGGWERLGKRCPRAGCNGELQAKFLSGTHMAIRCDRLSTCDYEKRERISDKRRLPNPPDKG